LRGGGVRLKLRVHRLLLLLEMLRLWCLLLWLLLNDLLFSAADFGPRVIGVIVHGRLLVLSVLVQLLRPILLLLHSLLLAVCLRLVKLECGLLGSVLVELGLRLASKNVVGSLLFLTFEHKCIFNFLLGEQVHESLVINAKFEIFTALEHSQIVIPNLELVHEGSLESLLFIHEDTVLVNTFAPRKFRAEHLNCDKPAIKLEAPSVVLLALFEHEANVFFVE